MKAHIFLATSALALAIFANADTLTTNLLTNPGGEAGSVAGWTVGGNSDPDVDNGTFDPGIDPHTGSFDFYGGTGSFGTLSQVVALMGTQGITPDEINFGNGLANVSFWEQGLNQGNPSDHAQITLTFLGAMNAVLGSAATPVVDSHNGTWQEGTESFVIPAGTLQIEYTMDFIRTVGSDNDSFIDDNSLTISPGLPSILSAIPEPGSGALFALGFAGFAIVVRYRHNRMGLIPAHGLGISKITSVSRSNQSDNLRQQITAD